MSNLPIRGPYDIMETGQDLEVEVEGKPNALIFKHAHREALRATVCGDCGNVGLSIENPQILWNIYNQREDS